MPQDPGLQPYNMKEDESIVDFMQRTTWFDAMTRALQKHSEFMQPFNSDGYPDMEYGYPDVGGLGPLGGDTAGEFEQPCNNCHFSAMWFDGPLGVKDAQFCFPYGGSFCMDAESQAAFDTMKATGVVPEKYRGSLGSYSSLASFGAALNASKVEVVQIEGKDEGYAEVGYADRREHALYFEDSYKSEAMRHAKKLCPSCWKCIGPWDGEWNFTGGPVTFMAQITDSWGNVCRDRKTLYYDCCNDPGVGAVSFDEASTADTVARSASITIYAQNGCPPYTWSETGTDFSLASLTTTSVTNTLTAGASACGECTITITDDCGNSDTISIRCTTGAWCELGVHPLHHVCCSGGAPPPDSTSYGGDYFTFNKIWGKWKQYQQIEGFSFGCGEYPGTVDTPCDCPRGGGTQGSYCLTWNPYSLNSQGQCISSIMINHCYDAGTGPINGDASIGECFANRDFICEEWKCSC